MVVLAKAIRLRHAIECSPDLSDCFGRLYERALTGANDPNTAQYTWDGAGNLTMRLDTGSSDQEDFTFDYVDRVTLASKSFDTNDSFTFDVTGNLTDLAGATYTYDAAKVHAAIQVGTVTYDYDANGNMTTRGNQTLTWDAANRLQYVDVGGVRIATYLRCRRHAYQEGRERRDDNLRRALL